MGSACHSSTRMGGTTLVEVLIVVVLLGFLGTWGASMFSDNFNTVRIVESDKTNADQMRYAMERVSRELREVQFITKANGGPLYSISSPNPLSPSSTSITFINGSGNTVTIAKSGSTVTIGGSTLASQVQTFTIDFYTVDSVTGAVSATTSNVSVRYMIVTLTTTDALSGSTLTERTRVTLRSS